MPIVALLVGLVVTWLICGAAAVHEVKSKHPIRAAIALDIGLVTTLYAIGLIAGAP